MKLSPGIVALLAFVMLICACAHNCIAQARRGPADLMQMRMGLFIHWVGPSPGKTTSIKFPDGREAVDINDFVDRINVQRVADEITAMRFEYVMLTNFHGLGTTLYPSAVLDRWRGPGYAPKRDVLGEMIKALAQRGIAVIIFTHPLDGHDFLPEQQQRLGWNDPAGNYKRWNDFINDVYAEMVDRYGKDVVGLGMDSEFGLSGNAEWKGKLDLPRLRKTILDKAPRLPLLALAGPNATCELGIKEIWRPSWHDPWMTRAETDYDVETWPSYRRLVAVVQGHHWATITPPDGGEARMNARQLYRYTVIQAACATEGPGIAWAASPYVDGTWERGVREEFLKLSDLMKIAGPSLRGVRASRSYPITEATTLKTLPHGIAATSRLDNTAEYIHVLYPPAGNQLDLPMAKDAKRFKSAKLIPSGARVQLTQRTDGVSIVLDDKQNWDPIDTIIELAVDPATTPRPGAAKPGNW